MRATMAPKGRIPPVAAISAAPRVDQARTTGTFDHEDKSAEPKALPGDTANRQFAACAGVAPRAVAAASMMATDAA